MRWLYLWRQLVYHFRDARPSQPRDPVRKGSRDRWRITRYRPSDLTPDFVAHGRGSGMSADQQGGHSWANTSDDRIF